MGNPGLGPLGSSDPLADSLMGASLVGDPLAGPFGGDPLGRPLGAGAMGQPAFGRPSAPAPAGDEGPNWILIGSIGGGVALVLLILVGVIVASSLSGGGNQVASNATPPAASAPLAGSAVPAPVPTGATSAAPGAPAVTSPPPGIAATPAGAGQGTSNPMATGISTPADSAIAGTPASGAPAAGPPGGAAVAGSPTATPGSTPSFNPGAVPGAGGSLPPRGGPGSAPGRGSGVGGSGGDAGKAGPEGIAMIRIIPARDPKGAYDTPESATPNLRGFGEALPRWHGDAKSKLAGVFRVGKDTRTTTQAHYSWMHNLLPLMGHQDTYDKFDVTKPLHDNVNIKFGAILVPEYLMPGNPRQRWEGYPFEHFALTHFVGMSGIEDTRNVVAGKFDRSDPRAGVFGYERIANPSEITDGTSNTLMVIGVGELANPWVMGGGATIRGARQPYFDKLSGFASHGQDGAVAIMADGSVRLLSSKTDPAVFRAMCTIHGADSVDLQTAAPPFKVN